MFDSDRFNAGAGCLVRMLLRIVKSRRSSRQSVVMFGGVADVSIYTIESNEVLAPKDSNVWISRGIFECPIS